MSSMQPFTTMMPSQIDVCVRAAQRTDVSRIVELAAELGYPVNVARVEAVLTASGDRTLFVATQPNDVVGWIALARDVSLLGEGDVWIEGLVVDEPRRGRGVGAQLLAAAHDWARERGCTRVRVRSNVIREEAHRFYEREGYRRFKTQHNFEFRL